MQDSIGIIPPSNAVIRDRAANPLEKSLTIQKILIWAVFDYSLKDLLPNLS